MKINKKCSYLALLGGVLNLFLVSLTGCGKDEPGGGGNNNQDSSEISVTLPSSVDVVKGEPCKITGANTIQTSDVIYLEKDGSLLSCPVTEATSEYFCFRLPSDIVSGAYPVRVKRGDRTKNIGTITINIVSAKIEIKPETTLYGVVESDEGPLKGVVVSDGVLVTTTDDKGVYQLASAKEQGFVFVSVPSGYECEREDVFPLNYAVVNTNNKLPENHSFKLKKVNQSKYKVIFLGDMHLGNRAGANGTSSNRDNAQFKGIAKDINSYVAANGSGPIYAITLGDMTWDLYWYDKSFKPADYKKYLNEQLDGVAVFHTIGNHDNDMNAVGQFNAKNPFAVAIAPPYYSFNIGGVHYVVLDNIDCSKYVGGGDANRDNQIAGKIYDPQFSWLAKDLQYVDKSTPVIVTMHVPVYSDSGIGAFSARTYSQEVINALNGYNVQFVTGHTHRNYNALPGNKGVGQFQEHNVAAVCSDWWWSGAKTTGCLVAPDGTPSGYAVWDITGKDMQYVYKCAGKDANYQFRAYDLNKVSFSASMVSGGSVSSSISKNFNNRISDYQGVQKNEVLINVWNYNTRWSVNVKTADGRDLKVTQVSAYDPVHIAASYIPRLTSTTTSDPIGSTSKDHHFFKVTAPDADTDLVITVKDEFGHVYTETMERPKAFTTAAYKIDLN